MKLTIVMASLLLTVSAAAAEEPKGLEGLPWGSQPATSREVLKNRCTLVESNANGVDVCADYKLSDVVGKLTLVNVQGRGLAAWRFDCPAADAGRLALLIASKFGPAPHDGPYQAFWGWPTTAVSLNKRECSVVFATREGSRRLEELERERVARTSKDSDGEPMTSAHAGGKRGTGPAAAGKGGG
jgi:hypothetical protein